MQEQNIYTFLHEFCNGVFKSKYHVFDQDFIQDSVLNIFLQYRRSESKIKNLKSWINGAIYKKFCSFCKKTKAHFVSFDEITENESVEILNRDIQTHILAESIDNLPPQNTRILTLRIYGGYSYTEISEQFGMNEGTVRKNYSRSLQLLRSTFH